MMNSIPDKNLVDFLNIVKLFPKFKYLAYAGTLLGIIRQNELIEWDSDIDMVILPDQYDTKLMNYIRIEMSNNGFSSVKIENGIQFIRKGGRKIDIQCLSEKLHENHLYYVLNWDVFRCNFDNRFVNLISVILAKLDNIFSDYLNIFKNIGKALSIYTKMEYRVPKKYLCETIMSHYHGHEIVIPKQSRLVLEELYGKSWMIPKQSKYWHFFSKPEIGSSD